MNAFLCFHECTPSHIFVNGGSNSNMPHELT